MGIGVKEKGQNKRGYCIGKKGIFLLGWIPRNRIARSYGKYMFNFLKNHQTILQNSLCNCIFLLIPTKNSYHGCSSFSTIFLTESVVFLLYSPMTNDVQEGPLYSRYKKVNNALIPAIKAFDVRQNKREN